MPRLRSADNPVTVSGSDPPWVCRHPRISHTVGMNYLAHGYRFLDNPLFLSGTAVPDWLCVSDRRTRVRSRRVEAARGRLTADEAQVADGICQHLADDDVFHRLVEFAEIEADLSARFRRHMPDPFDHRPGFLGHVVAELMLDAWLAESQPGLLRAYYAALESADPELILSAVNRVAARPAERLPEFILQFRRLQFLYDYLDDERLLGRLNQVLRRVTLPPLDDSHRGVLADARRLLRQQGDRLLNRVRGDTPNPVRP